MLDRSIAPSFVEAQQFVLPKADQRTLANGVDLFIMRDVQQEVLKIELLFKAGKWYEPQLGLSHFTAYMLEKGTTSKSAATLAEIFDGLGAHIEITPGYDLSTVSLYCLTKNWKQAFYLLMEIVTTPSFPEEELELMKNIFVQNLHVNLEKNSFVASQLIRKNIFGDEHPYGTSADEASVATIKADLLKAFHKKVYQPFAVFVTAGESFEEDEVVQALSQFSLRDEKSESTVQVGKCLKKEVVEKEGSIQTAIRLARKSIFRTHPDYPPLLLFNHILGGYFGSRLMKNIREEKGLTYGIYSSLQTFQKDSFWLIGADVNKENVSVALQEIHAELLRMQREEVPADELIIARNHFLGSLQSEVANPFSVTDKMKNIYLNQLPPDFYQSLFDQLKKVTPTDLVRIGATYFKEEELTVVTVG